MFTAKRKNYWILASVTAVTLVGTGRPLQAQPAPPPPAPPAVVGGAPEAKARAMAMISGRGAYLGVGVKDVDSARAKELKLSDEYGVEVTNVEDDSPASKAGIKVGDVVLEYQGQRVEGTETFVRMVRETPPGRTAKLHISRGGSVMNLTATIAARKARTFSSKDFKGFDSEGGFRFEMPEIVIPDTPKVTMGWRSSTLGVEAEALESQLAEYFGVKKGVLVRSVQKGTPAESAGLKAGDVITKVDGTAVSTPKEIYSMMRNGNKSNFSLSYMRDKREASVSVTVEQRKRSFSGPQAPDPPSPPKEFEF